MLPTPTLTGNNNRKGLSEKSGDGLATVIRGVLPTPTKSSPEQSGAYGNGSPTLAWKLAGLMPTPAAQTQEGGMPIEGGARGRARLRQVMPTPTKADAEGSLGQMRGDGRKKRHLSSLLASQPSKPPAESLGSEAVLALASITEWLMGFEPGWLLRAWPLGSRIARRLRPGRTMRGPA